MKRNAAHMLGLVMGLIAMLALPACAGTQAQQTSQSEGSAQAQNTDDSDSAHQEQRSAAEQIKQAAQATARETAEAAEVVGRTLTGTQSPEAQAAGQKQRQRNAEQIGLIDDPEQAEAQNIGGGPVDSETIATLDAIDTETKDYEARIKDAEAPIDDATQLRFEQVQQDAKDLRTQYEAMKDEADMDAPALDAQYKGSAEQIEASWEQVSEDLRRELGEAP